MSSRPSPVRPATNHRHRLASRVALIAGALAVANHAHAAIVNLDLGPSGFNLLGPNGGIAPGSTRTVWGFPVAGPTLGVVNNDSGNHGLIGGGGGANGLNLAFTGYANPRNFSLGGSIDGTAFWTAMGSLTQFKVGASTAPNWGLGSYMGFRFTTDGGTNWNYGWLSMTWDGTTFEILSGAYESTAGQTIAAGATAGGGGGGGAERRTPSIDDHEPTRLP